MTKVHPVAAILAFALIILTAEAFVSREKSLVSLFFGSIGT